MEELVQKLTKVTDPSRMILLVSLPGMGKTQVAIRVSRDPLLQNKKAVIFIEKQENLTDVCSEILRRLSGRRLSESHDLVSIAARRLKEVREDTVIVLDSTEDVQGKQFDEFAQNVINYAPHVQLIITIQKDVGFTSLNVYVVGLRPLDPDSSARLLQESVVECEDYAKELVKVHGKEFGVLCGGMLLFLVHIACLLKNDFSSQVLIQQLRDNPIQLLKTNAKDVYNALGKFLDMFPDNITGNLVPVSGFPSTFSGKDIQFLFDDQLELETVKTEMVKCPLLQKMKNGMVALHPLVRDCCRAERKFLKMVDTCEVAQYKFNGHYLSLLRTISKQFISEDSALKATSVLRNEKANIMEALKNCLDDKSDAEEKGFGIDVANSTEVLDFLAKVISPPAECTKLYQRCCALAEASGDKKRLADSLNALGFRCLCDVGHREGDRGTLRLFQQAYGIRATLPEKQQTCETHAHTICKLRLCYSLQVISLFKKFQNTAKSKQLIFSPCKIKLYIHTASN